MIIFCKDLKEPAMTIINYDQKKIIPLTDKKKSLLYMKKKNLVWIKNSVKLEIIAIIQGNIEELLIVFVI